MELSNKPLIIPVFIPHSGCPHQCAFCNQSIITNQESRIPDKAAIHQIITQYLQYKGRRKHVELAFFGGNFLGLSESLIIQLLEWISPYVQDGKIDGIRFSTRPDTITPETLDLLKPYPVMAVELGVQSMNDSVLSESRRGHTSMDTIKAMDLLKKYQLKTGVQVMSGLPGDSENSLLASTKKLAGLAPDFARIYPLMVLKGSLMASWYKNGRYQPLSLDESIRLVKKMYLIFKAADIDVIRMGLQASDLMEDDSMMLAGPWHPAFGHLVFSEIMYDRVCDIIDNDKDLLSPKGLFLNINSKSESRLRGNKNTGFEKLKLRYPEHDFTICRDDKIPINQVDIKGR